MVAIIGGEPRRFRPLIDLYRETGKQHGYSAEQLRVGVHMLGYVADTTQEAADTFFPGYAKAMTDIGKERGWPAMTRASFDAQRGRDGALLIGSPDEVSPGRITVVSSPRIATTLTKTSPRSGTRR